jgi:hypothetical protein
MTLLAAFVATAACALPISLSAWALLDAAHRPQWAWAMTDRRQVVWMSAILLGTFFVFGGIVVSAWYLHRIRPAIAAAEEGRLDLR